MGTLRLRLFGIFDATLDGAPLENLRLRHAARLLGLLACRHGRACQDTWLAQMLWPDTESLDSLRSSIVALRRALGPDAWRVETGNTTIRLRTEGADIDVMAFDDLVKQGNIDSLRAAIPLYTGRLLEGWDDGWVQQERERRSEAHVEALRLVGDHAMETCSFAEAARLYRRLVRARSVEEHAWQGLFRALIEMGERLEAMRIYEGYRDRLASRGLAPPAEMALAYQKLVAAPLGPAPELSPAFAGFEPIGGAVPLSSPYYVERSSDAECHAALSRHDSFVLIRGARQIGKTSLIVRGLDHTRKAGSRVALTDLQRMSEAELADPGVLFPAMMCSLADQLGLDPAGPEEWRSIRSPGVNFERFLTRHALAPKDGRLVWALDEVDRLFTRSYRADVFGLMRSWHNARTMDDDGPWNRLTVIIAYASDAALFIPDGNQSPFNVGTHVQVHEFSRAEIEELNRRYGNPLRTVAEMDALIELVGGHPYLVRRALHALVTTALRLADLTSDSAMDLGLFGDHLDQMLVALQHDTDMVDAVRDLLDGNPVGAMAAGRLRSAGWITAEGSDGARLRCGLYERFLTRHLGTRTS